MQQRGRANTGDKTKLDSYLPFVDALDQRVGEGAGIADAWTDALAAADEGARSTADMRPKIGCARPLAERSLGHADPGAVSLAHCLVVVGDVLRRDCG